MLEQLKLDHKPIYIFTISITREYFKHVYVATPLFHTKKEKYFAEKKKKKKNWATGLKLWHTDTTWLSD